MKCEAGKGDKETKEDKEPRANETNGRRRTYPEEVVGRLVVRGGNVHIPVQWAGLPQIFAQMVDLRNGCDNVRFDSTE